MVFKNFWHLSSPEPTTSAPAEGGFSSRVEDYGESEGDTAARSAYDPEEEEGLEDNDPVNETGTGASLQEQSPTGASKQDAPFSPYEFKGKVNGEEIAQKFESKKDLDVAIARGIQAPKIYEALQSAKKDLAALKADAEWAQDLQALAKEDPKEFFENVVEELMDEKELAEWVYHKYQEYTRLANLSPEEMAREKQLKAADKLMREQAYHEQTRKASEAAAAKARSEQEKVELMSWANKEKQAWMQKLPPSMQNNMDQYIQTVAIVARARLDAGEQYGLKEMSNHLKQLLSPLTSTPQNPAQVKREEANRGAANAQANKEALQNLAANSAKRNQPSTKKSRQNMWQDIKKMATSGL
jgi:hypothetical protein